MVEKKVYNGWAFDNDYIEKRDTNSTIYQELKKKYKIAWKNNKNKQELNDSDIIIGLSKVGYGHNVYDVYKKPSNITDDEIALICDDGNLCFGYMKENDGYHIFTD